jgi:hypothetical protein
VDSLTTAPLYGHVKKHIYIILTIEGNTLIYYDLWDPRKKDEQLQKI